MIPGKKIFSKIIPGDCPICAVRPCLYLNHLNVCLAHFFCKHSEPSTRSHFKLSKKFKFVNISCSLILIVGIINDIQHLDKRPDVKNLIMLLEAIIAAITVLVNILCLTKQNIKIKESHGLITLIDKKFLFNVNQVLSTSSAKKIYDLLSIILLVFVAEEMVTLCRNIVAEDLDVVILCRIVSIEVLIFCNASLGFYVLEFLFLYGSVFENCYQEMEKCLMKKEKEFLKKLQTLQRFYMCLRRNFQLNESFIQPGIIMNYTIAICLLLIGYSYIVVLFVEDDLNLTTFDLYVIVKSVAIVLVFGAFCYEAQKLLFTNQKMLSSLFKCSTSKLSPIETSQILMIAETLTLQKPDLRASNVFTVDTGLLASVAGTVVTYALVALQFRALVFGK